MHLLLVGCGYLGAQVARLATAAGHHVTAWTRTPESADQLRADPANPFPILPADISDPESVRAALRSGPRPPAAYDRLLTCVSTSGRGGPEAYRQIHLLGLRNLLDHLPAARPFFTSSTSVYHQTQGETVTETSPAEPVPETSRILLQAENLALSASGVALRLAALYGPGRSVLLAKLLERTATLEGDGGRWLNHIHLQDAATATLHLLLHAPDSPEIYNLADDTPLTQLQAYQRLSHLTGLPLPPHGPPPDPATRKRGLTSKRVLNHKLRSTG